MANIKPFMQCKISCSLWLILMYAKRCLLEVERSQKGHREAWVLPQLSSYLASICTHHQSPGQSLCPRHLHGQLCCFQLCSPDHFCSAALSATGSISDHQSLPLSALQMHGSPHYTCVVPRQAPSQSSFDLPFFPFYILIYWKLYPPFTKRSI